MLDTIDTTLLKTTTKTKLAKYYNVDRATFSKWLIFFCDDLFETRIEILKRRKFTDSEVKNIKERLGINSTIYRKSDIIEILDSTYQTIRDNIEIYPSTCGISIATYNQLSKFPPKIAERIIQGLE